MNTPPESRDDVTAAGTVPRDAATARQVRAADPATSTWLSANAGSGKTSVLIDRVARMLMAGVSPQRILCLTYTKAAASEMQNRLFARLGTWAMREDAELAQALRRLGIAGAVDDARLRQARRLFARAIETPGGLKIQTIHSFCGTLLRRFPLEARVSPQFREIDDRAARLLRDEVVEDLADLPGPNAVDAVAARFNGADLAGLTAEIARHRTAFAAPLGRDAALAVFGLPPDFDAATLLRAVFLGDEAATVAAILPGLAAGLKTDTDVAAILRSVAFADPGFDDLEMLEDCLLTKSGATAPYSAKTTAIPTKATKAKLGALVKPLHDLMERVEAARPRRLGLATAERTLALHRFAAAFLPEYDRRKAARGWLDFDDLILKARALLTDPAVAGWVLFRLDGGLDHILIDEAQDTSPEQWAVIERLAQEFTAGQGAADGPRTLFVVGDKKQSIYSFQGADLRQFDAMRDHFRDRLAVSATPLADLTLSHSFRSSPAILRLVDATFSGPQALAGLGGPVTHEAFRDIPGRVDLWPAIEPSGKTAQSEWYDPVDLRRDSHHEVVLARTIAAEIRRMIDAQVVIPTRQGDRPLGEGDILILVRRRSGLFPELVRACKAAGLAIAGADRLKLGAELAVKDIAAVLGFLATPEDDLSLAAALRSPLFGWTEAALFDLAQPRDGAALWTALWHHPGDAARAARGVLSDLRDAADFLRPYDLIERILTRHDGRRRLLARLGPEAEDGIDALLAQALAYERAAVPSVTGFLGWLDADNIDVKRELGRGDGRIRVMTVHGAKGLESPVVILPDTACRNPPQEGEVLRDADRAWWSTTADASPAAIVALRADAAARQAEERLRLLYVALTRAESWLIVCAAGKVGGAGDSWYRLVEEGIARLTGPAAGPGLFPTGAGQRLAHGVWPGDETGAQAALTIMPVPTMPGAVVPQWAREPAAAAPQPDRVLSPSALGGAKVIEGERDFPVGTTEGEDALLRGHRLHLLLEHLPLWSSPDHAGLARDLLRSAADTATDAEIAELVAEAQRVLGNPDLSHLFAADALTEVGITAQIAGRRIVGAIDRLLVAPGSVLAVDYKSNVLVPATPAAVPAGILRQMGAYAAALAQIYPAHQVETAILWTRTATLMLLPPALVNAALQAAPLS